MHSDSVEYRELTNNAPEGILAGTYTTILPRLASIINDVRSGRRIQLFRMGMLYLWS